MASPISPGDIVALAQGVYKLYKKFKDAPEEMQELGRKVSRVEMLLQFLNKPGAQLDYLNTDDGKKMNDWLQIHLKNLKRTLRQIKDVGKQWQKARGNLFKRVPFTFYTIPTVVPGLRESLLEELEVIEEIRRWAFQAGVGLSPAARAQLVSEIAAKVLNKSRAGNDQKLAQAEKNRQAAVSALKKSSTGKRSESAAESKSCTYEGLRENGVEAKEAKILSELFELELEKERLGASIASVKSSTSTKSIRSVKLPIKPKVQVPRLKPAGKPLGKEAPILPKNEVVIKPNKGKVNEEEPSALASPWGADIEPQVKIVREGDKIFLVNNPAYYDNDDKPKRKKRVRKGANAQEKKEIKKEEKDVEVLPEKQPKNEKKWWEKQNQKQEKPADPVPQRQAKTDENENEKEMRRKERETRRKEMEMEKLADPVFLQPIKNNENEKRARSPKPQQEKKHDKKPADEQPDEKPSEKPNWKPNEKKDKPKDQPAPEKPKERRRKKANEENPPDDISDYEIITPRDMVNPMA